jgi:hypothetical protein
MESAPVPAPATKKRPIPVTVVSCLLMAAGAAGIIYHGREFAAAPNLGNVFILLVRLLAIVGGTFMLLGRNWARWLSMLWIAFHVGVSLFHPLAELAMHVVVLAVFAYALFRADARDYFHGGSAGTSW